MSLIDKIKAKYSGAPLQKSNVPEWEQDVYFKRLTTDELDASASETPEGASATRSNLQLVVIKALDKDGKRLFSSNDADVLSATADPIVINRLASDMMAITSVEEAKKN